MNLDKTSYVISLDFLKKVYEEHTFVDEAKTHYNFAKYSAETICNRKSCYLIRKCSWNGKNIYLKHDSLEGRR